MQLTQHQSTLKAKMSKSLAIMADEIKKALPREMDQGRFSRVVLTAVSRNPKLLECEETSFFASLLLSAQLGLEPNGPDQKCFLIPYKKEVQFQLGYRGLLELVRRSGELTSIHAEVAYENDHDKDIILGIEPTIIHKPLIGGNRGKALFAYSVAKFKDGSVDFEWMSVEDIEKAKNSNPANSPAWTNWWSEMAKKTVIKRHTKRLPINAEIQRKINSDETSKTHIAEDMTESQDGEQLKDVEARVIEEDERKKASHVDKNQFYDFCSKNGLSHLITIEEKTKINGTIETEYLHDLKIDLKKRQNSVNQVEKASSQEPDEKDF